MRNKTIKIIVKLLLIILIIQPILVTEVNAGFWDDIFNSGENFINMGKSKGQQVESEKVRDISNAIFNVLFALGVVFSVVVGAIIGIKFMISSATDKAKIKEALVPYVAGCIVIFGASGIWKLCITVLSAI